MVSLRAERHSHANFTRPLQDCLNQNTIDSDRGKQKSDRSEDTKEQCAEPRLCEISGKQVLHSIEVVDGYTRIEHLHCALNGGNKVFRIAFSSYQERH